VGVVLAGQHAAKLHLADARLDVAEGRGGLDDAGLVLGLAPEVVEGLGVIEALLGVAQVVEQLLQGRLLAQDLLGAIVVAPEGGVRGLGVEFFESLYFAFVVKDAAVTRPIGPRDERAAR
jgi:hypothetical protein